MNTNVAEDLDASMLYPEDGSSMFLQNIRTHIPNKTSSHISLMHPREPRNFCKVKRKVVSKSLWRCYINRIIVFLDIIHRPVFIVSESGFCLRLQVEPTQLGPIDRASSYPRVIPNKTTHDLKACISLCSTIWAFHAGHEM
jgi:hypothetical protein